MDPRAYLAEDEVPIDRPVFLLGTQGGGLTLLSRMLHRSRDVVAAAGGSSYWTSADEMQNVFGLRLPFDLTGLRYKAPDHPEFPAPRSWTYAARDLYPLYRRTASDATPELRTALTSVIRYCGKRFATDPRSWRFLDKSQVYTVRMGLIHALLEPFRPKFVLVVRNPYIATYRAATGAASDMVSLTARLGLPERLDIGAEHYANSVRAVLDDAAELDIDVPIVRFEDLLAQPDSTLSRVCDHVGLPFDTDMVPAPHHRLPLGTRLKERWYPLRPDVNQRYLDDMPASVKDIVERHFVHLWDVLGYERL